MAFPAFLDACVLVPIALTDTLLRLAEADTYRPLWSDEVLGEVERNLPNVSRIVTPTKARRRIDMMRTHFPDALVTGYEALIPIMTNDPKDRHVLAAAIRGDAAVIVTANLDDFAADALQPYDITAVHPDDFLLDQLDLYPRATVQCMHEQITAYNNPAMNIAEFLGHFSETVPKFADAVDSLLLGNRERH
jgi:predicted nucleic acid-binding protein